MDGAGAGGAARERRKQLTAAEAVNHNTPSPLPPREILILVPKDNCLLDVRATRASWNNEERIIFPEHRAELELLEGEQSRRSLSGEVSGNRQMNPPGEQAAG